MWKMCAGVCPRVYLRRRSLWQAPPANSGGVPGLEGTLTAQAGGRAGPGLLRAQVTEHPAHPPSAPSRLKSWVCLVETTDKTKKYLRRHFWHFKGHP